MEKIALEEHFRVPNMPEYSDSGGTSRTKLRPSALMIFLQTSMIYGSREWAKPMSRGQS